MPRGEAFVRGLLARAAAHGITNPRQLAIKSGVSYDAIRGWKRGTAPTTGTLDRLQPWTGLTVAQMLNLWEGAEPDSDALSVDPITASDTGRLLTRLVEETTKGRIAQEKTAKLLAEILGRLVPAGTPPSILVPDEFGSPR